MCKLEVLQFLLFYKLNMNGHLINIGTILLLFQVPLELTHNILLNTEESVYVKLQRREQDWCHWDSVLPPKNVTYEQRLKIYIITHLIKSAKLTLEETNSQER